MTLELIKSRVPVKNNRNNRRVGDYLLLLLKLFLLPFTLLHKAIDLFYGTL